MWTPADRALVGDYGSDQALSDNQYRLLEPLIPPARPGGRPRATNMRRLLDSMFYLLRAGASGGICHYLQRSCRSRPCMATFAPFSGQACETACATILWLCCAREPGATDRGDRR